MANHYHPSSEVKSLHNIPPIQTFDKTPSYFKGIIIFPLIILGLGVISLLSFLLYFYCCKSKGGSRRYIAYKRHSNSSFFLFTALAFILSFFVLIGNAPLNYILRDVAYLFLYFSKKITQIDNIAIQLASAATNITSLYIDNTNSPCSTAAAFYGIQGTISDTCNTIASAALGASNNQGTADELKSIHDVILSTIIPAKSAVIFIILGLSILTPLLLLLSYRIKSICTMNMSVLWSSLIILIISIVVAVEMGLAVSVYVIRLYVYYLCMLLCIPAMSICTIYYGLVCVYVCLRTHPLDTAHILTYIHLTIYTASYRRLLHGPRRSCTNLRIQPTSARWHKILLRMQ